jgi:hypothetical protein
MKKQITYLLFLLLPYYSCLDDQDMPGGIVNGKREPTVVTNELFEIPVEGTIRMKGDITSMGKGSNVINKGFFWGYSADTLNHVLYANNSFSADLSNIPGDKTYYWRAFAENEYGVDSGKIVKYIAPKIWEAKEEFRSFVRWRFTYFSLNNKLYMVCGQGNAGSLSEIWEYNVSENKWWGTIENFPGEARRFPVSFTIGNLAYVGTGQINGGAIVNDFFCFDGISRTWDKTTIIPQNETEEMSKRYQAIAFGLNNKGYVIGGGSSPTRTMSDVWQFSISDDTSQWKKMNDLPAPFYGGISICNGTSAYIGFGENVEARKILWKYIEETDSWVEFAQLPDEIEKSVFSGVIIRDRIYIVDGDNIIWELNLSDKRWKQKMILPDFFLHSDGDGGNECMFTVGNSIYIGLGFSQYFYEYRPLWDN